MPPSRAEPHAEASAMVRHQAGPVKACIVPDPALNKNEPRQDCCTWDSIMPQGMGACKVFVTKCTPKPTQCAPNHQLHLLLHTLQLTMAQCGHPPHVLEGQLRLCPISLLHLQSDDASAVLDVSSCLKTEMHVPALLGVGSEYIVRLQPEKVLGSLGCEDWLSADRHFLIGTCKTDGRQEHAATHCTAAPVPQTGCLCSGSSGLLPICAAAVCFRKCLRVCTSTPQPIPTLQCGLQCAAWQGCNRQQ